MPTNLQVEPWTVAFTMNGVDYEWDALEIVSADADLPQPKDAAGNVNSIAFWQQRIDWIKEKTGVEVSPSQAFAVFTAARLRWDSAKKSFELASESAFGITPTAGA